MKYIIRIFITGLLFVGIASCEKYLDINDNPNQATKPPINGLLARATFDAAINVFRVSNVTSYYVQYLSSPNPASATDTYEPIDASSTWTELYDNMSDSYDLYKLGEEKNATEYMGAAKVLQAMDLIHVHDLWGDAPYTEAFAGDQIKPKYDDARTNYNRVISLLNEGIDLLKRPGSAIKLSASDDLIHKGKVDAWVKTAYALKARMLNRLSKTSEYKPEDVLAAISLSYTSRNDDAAISVFDIRNPWCQVAVNNAALLLDGWLSEQLIDMMNGKTYGLADKRIEKMTDTTKFGDYRGTPNGKGRTGSGISREECYINQTGYYSSTTSPLYIISYEEVLFIEAEAALRSGNPTRAYTAYLKGITSSFDKMGVSSADRDLYVNNAVISVGAAALTLDMIFREKYKALYLSPETWSDARRYDYKYKDFGLPLNASTSDFVRRLVYPSVETSRNGENTPVVDDVTSKLWWDK